MFKNIKKYYDGKGQKVMIELVAYGPGLHMFREDTSPVKDRLASMSLAIEGLIFSACGNTSQQDVGKGGQGDQAGLGSLQSAFRRCPPHRAAGTRLRIHSALKWVTD